MRGKVYDEALRLALGGNKRKGGAEGGEEKSAKKAKKAEASKKVETPKKTKGATPSRRSTRTQSGSKEAVASKPNRVTVEVPSAKEKVKNSKAPVEQVIEDVAEEDIVEVEGPQDVEMGGGEDNATRHAPLVKCKCFLFRESIPLTLSCQFLHVWKIA